MTTFETGKYYADVQGTQILGLYKATEVHETHVVLDTVGDDTAKPRALFFNWPDITVVDATEVYVRPGLDAATHKRDDAAVRLEAAQAVVDEFTAALNAVTNTEESNG